MVPRSAAAAGWLAGMLLTGCTAEPEPPVASHFRYACCEARDTEETYRPGQVLTLHWIAEEAPGPAARVELTAKLTGPFNTASELKKSPAGRSGLLAFAAAPVRPDGSAGGRPVSTIRIPADAPPGFYDLITGVIEGRSGMTGSTVIEVVAG